MQPDEMRALVRRAQQLALDRREPRGASLQQAVDLVREIAPRLTPELKPPAARILWTTGFYEEADALGGLAELGRICVEQGQPEGLIHQFPKVRADADRQELVALHRAWGEAAAARAMERPIPRAPRASGDRLRLGILSADLRHHVVGHLAYPLFRYPDPRFELRVYKPSRDAPDPAQTWFASRAARFEELPSDDRAAAETIAADGLDVLLDLGGPTTRNRPEILAWRPAPLQLSWLGYPHSLGLPTVDGILLDANLAPERRELLLEDALRLPGAWFAMSAAAFQPEPGVTFAPAARRGQVTFATANDPYKYSPALLRTWARVLAAVPGSRFRFIRHETGCASLRKNLTRHFAAAGVAADRLEFPSMGGGYRQLYDDVDIALDTFPMSGGMTTCEALWMGVPTVTLRGEAVFERISGSLMASAGLPELVARSADDYVRIAVALANDTPRLADLRRTMRERIAAHPLGQPEAFAGGFYDTVAAAVAESQAR